MIDNQLSAELLTVAVAAARRAGSIVMSAFRGRQTICARTPHDVKLEIDERAEACILESVFTAFPGHGFISEEAGAKKGVEDFVWIIDPVDGTVNYFHGLAQFCISIACYAIPERCGRQHRTAGVPLVGVVYQPLVDELYSAVVGRGAQLNGKQIKVASGVTLSESIACVGLTNRHGGGCVAARMIERLVEEARKVRCFGATALDSVQIAAGRIGAFMQRGTNLWDFAAAKIIVQEAGGFYDVFEFLPGRYKVIAGCPGVKEDMYAIAEEMTEERWEGNGLLL